MGRSQSPVLSIRNSKSLHAIISECFGRTVGYVADVSYKHPTNIVTYIKPLISLAVLRDHKLSSLISRRPGASAPRPRGKKKRVQLYHVSGLAPSIAYLQAAPGHG